MSQASAVQVMTAGLGGVLPLRGGDWGALVEAIGQSPLSVVLAPLLAAFVIPLVALFARRFLLPTVMLSGLITFLASLLLAAAGWQGTVVTGVGGWGALSGVVLAVDQLSAAFLVIVAIGAGATGMVAACRLGMRRWRFHVLFFLLWAGLNGLMVTADLFNLFVFLELSTVVVCILIAFKDTGPSVEAALKFLIVSTVGALFLLLGIANAYMASGALNLGLLSTFFAENGLDGFAGGTVAALILTGLLVKLGVVPFHFWLPDAQTAARAEVSPMLAGAVEKAGAYVLIRISFTVLGVEGIYGVMLVLGALSIVVGHSMALYQTDFKRLLAFSTVAQMGYILLGAGAASSLGIAGAMVHALIHMVTKIVLFTVAGVFVARAGSRDYRHFTGLGRHMPMATALFFLAAAVLVGLPPTGGFMSKWTITMALMAGGHAWAALVIAFGTVVSAYYYFLVLQVMLLPEGATGSRGLDGLRVVRWLWNRSFRAAALPGSGSGVPAGVRSDQSDGCEGGDGGYEGDGGDLPTTGRFAAWRGDPAGRTMGTIPMLVMVVLVAIGLLAGALVLVPEAWDSMIGAGEQLLNPDLYRGAVTGVGP